MGVETGVAHDFMVLSQDGSGAQPAPAEGAPCERQHIGVENAAVCREAVVPATSGFWHSHVHVPVIIHVFLM